MNDQGRPIMSVVVPFFNEQECVRQVCAEILEVLEPVFGGRWEFIAVDDGSDDDTGNILEKAVEGHPCMRVIRSQERSGQSAALKLGFVSARGGVIGTLDGDGQNDPRDLPGLLKEMELRGVHMVTGIRVNRHDNWVRRMSSRIANRVRSTILKDNTSDVGCAVRVLRRQCLEGIHLFRNFHRFFPALFVMNGYSVAEVPVNHRPRFQGPANTGAVSGAGCGWGWLISQGSTGSARGS